MWTKFEEGKSRRSSVIDRKRQGYRPTDQPTCAKLYALSSSKGGHKNSLQGHFSGMYVSNCCTVNINIEF